MKNIVVDMQDIVTVFGEHVIHDRVSITIHEGEIYALIGGSGSGKSTLLKEMIMLIRPLSGKINVLGMDITAISAEKAGELKTKWGVLFQSGALFSSLTVAENIAIMLQEYTDLPRQLINTIVATKIDMVGLPAHAASLFPAQLSGGMIKRASLARALAMDPQILFLDEPTSGLDPVGAEEFDQLILRLRELLGITVVMVTHDLDSIWSIVDKFSVLGNQKIVASGTLDEVISCDHPIIEKFFKGTRGSIRSKL